MDLSLRDIDTKGVGVSLLGLCSGVYGRANKGEKGQVNDCGKVRHRKAKGMAKRAPHKGKDQVSALSTPANPRSSCLTTPE